MSAIPPDRADGVDDPFGRQFVALGDSCLASRAPAQLSAFLEQLWAGGAMDGAIHPAAAEQGRVGGVDNCIHLLMGDVTFDNQDAIRNCFFAHRRKKVQPPNFFFNGTATPEIYTLSLHAALPLAHP